MRPRPFLITPMPLGAGGSAQRHFTVDVCSTPAMTGAGLDLQNGELQTRAGTNPNMNNHPNRVEPIQNLGNTGSLQRPSKLLAGGMLAVILVIAATVLAGPEDKDKGSSVEAPRMVFAVTHGQVATILVTPGSPGHQLGDLRVLPATPILNESGRVVGRLDANLLTTSVNYPGPGDEVRMSTLNFVFGEGDAQLSGLADQLIVSGSGLYPGTGSTIAPGTTLVRPVTGGSGKFAGARGWAESEHLGDGTWRHTFHIQTEAHF